MPYLYVVIVFAILIISIISKGLIVVRQAQVVIVERLGRYYRTLDSGIHIIIPIFDKTRPIHWRYNKSDFRGNVVVVSKIEDRIDLREKCTLPTSKCDHHDNVSFKSCPALLPDHRTLQRVYENGNCRKPSKKLPNLSAQRIENCN